MKHLINELKHIETMMEFDFFHAFGNISAEVKPSKQQTTETQTLIMFEISQI